MRSDMRRARFFESGTTRFSTFRSRLSERLIHRAKFRALESSFHSLLENPAKDWRTRLTGWVEEVVLMSSSSNACLIKIKVFPGKYSI